MSTIPCKVYLDQSDWSYLCDGKSPQAEAVFRRLGTEQRVAFLVSFEHFIEVGGLKTGFNSRLQFMREFPSAFWMNRSSLDIIQQEVLAMVAAVNGEPIEPLRIDGRLLSREEPEEIKRTIRAYTPVLRAAFSAMAGVERIGRAPMAGRRAEARRAHDRAMAAFLSGDTGGWLKYVDLSAQTAHPILRSVHRRLAPIYNGVFSRVHPVIAEMAGQLIARGLLAPPEKSLDRTYTSCVLPNLPRGFARTPGQRELNKLWKNKDRRYRSAPCVACVAAIEEAIYNDSNYTYRPSDIVDGLHSAFAPLVDLFTCDKRSARQVQTVIRKSGRKTVILRSGRLDEVAAVLAQQQSR